jgi:hypothetical protein
MLAGLRKLVERSESRTGRGSVGGWWLNLALGNLGGRSSHELDGKSTRVYLSTTLSAFS